RRVGGGRGLAEQARDEAHLEHAEAEAATGLPREQSDDLVASRLEDVGGLQEDRLALRREALRPLREGRGCCLDRAPRVVARAGGDVGDDVAGERVAVLERRALRRVRPLAADELLRLAYVTVDARHVLSFSWPRASVAVHGPRVKTPF